MTDIDPFNLSFATRFPDEFARILGRGEASESSKVLESLPDELKASIVARLPGSRIEQLLASKRHSPQRWIADAPFDDALTLLSRIPRERRLAMVNALKDRDRRQRLLRHQQFPVHSIGSIVSDFPLRIRADLMAADVLAELRDLRSEDPGLLVVVDTNGAYLGLVDRWRLMIGNPPVGPVRDYTVNVEPVRPETPIFAVVQNENWHTRNWLPVVDHRDRVLGGVSRAAVFRAAGRQTQQARSANDVLTDLMTDLIYVFGALLDWALARRNAS